VAWPFWACSISISGGHHASGLGSAVASTATWTLGHRLQASLTYAAWPVGTPAHRATVQHPAVNDVVLRDPRAPLVSASSVGGM
jgi:hypothetical protein